MRLIYLTENSHEKSSTWQIKNSNFSHLIDCNSIQKKNMRKKVRKSPREQQSIVIIIISIIIARSSLPISLANNKKTKREKRRLDRDLLPLRLVERDDENRQNCRIFLLLLSQSTYFTAQNEPRTNNNNWEKEANKKKSKTHR